MRIISLVIILYFAACFTQAQTPHLIRGIIKDQVSQLPVESANIQLTNTQSGTSTNGQGIFELSVSKFPAILSVTHISYFGKQIIATQKNSNLLIITLNPRIVNLEETEITAETYKVFKGPNQEVIDYDFLDTDLLILTYNFNKYHHELVLTDEHLDTLTIRDISSFKKPKQIFKDCMGNCHLLTNDSAYQVHLDKQSIYLAYPTDLKNFFNFLGDCLFETPKHLAFEGNTDKKPKIEYASRNLYDLPTTKSEDEDWKHLFYFVNKESHKKTILDNVYEWKKKRDAFERAIFVVADPVNVMTFGDILRFEEMTFYKPSFQTVKFLNDTIYYFNHLKSQIDIYSDDLVLLKSVKVEYHNKLNWTPAIITDVMKDKAYTIFTTGVMNLLSEINLQDGTVHELTKINKLFPQKIKVNNGHLYFLYKDLNKDWSKRKLYQGVL